MKIKKVFSILVIIKLLLPLFSVISVIPMNASAQQLLPTVTIALTESSQMAHVGPGDTGEVTFNGIVQVAQNRFTRVVVSLTAEDTWNSAIVEPSTLLFTSGGSQPFTVSVRVTPGESCETVGTVTVTGRWRMYPGTLGGSAEPQDGTTGRIDVAQYHQLEISSPNSYTRASLDERIEFELFILNEGNGDENVLLDILNNDELSSNGISVSISSSEFHITINEEKYAKIFVNTFSGTVGGNHDIEIGITTVYDPYGIDDMWLHTFTIELPENSNTPPGNPEPEPEPPLPEPQPEPEPEPEPEPDNSPDTTDEVITGSGESDEMEFLRSRDFIFLMLIFFATSIGLILVIGWAKERRFNKRIKRARKY
jgi:hypothetical protein